MKRSRRAVLTGMGAAGVVGVAGCLGDDTPDAPEYDCDLTEPEAPDHEFRPVIGDPDSEVLVQTFEDFTCGGCATFKAEQFPEIREAHIDTGDVRYEHWDFPIPVDEAWAIPVASAARGVGAREGSEAFFEFAAYEAPIMEDRGEGEARGLDATPTVYVNGDPVDPTAEAVAEAIESVQS